MYLPHLPSQGNEYGAQGERAPVVEPGLLAHRVAHGEEEENSPTAANLERNGEIGGEARQSCQTSIHGVTPYRDHGEEPRRAETVSEHAAGGSARRTKDRHASIRISLDQHAERVAKKQRTVGDDAIVRETAAQRMAAVRARVLARCTAAMEARYGTEGNAVDTRSIEKDSGEDSVAERVNRSGSDEKDAGGANDHPMERTARMPAAGVTAGAGTATATRRNELPKIHFIECMSGIREPAWGGQDADRVRDAWGAVSASDDAGTGGATSSGVGGPRGRGAAETAMDVAASRVAWHTEGIEERPNGGLG